MKSFWSQIPKVKLKQILEALYLLPPKGQGLTYQQMAEKLNLTGMGVRHLLEYCNIPLRGKRTDHLAARNSRLHDIPVDEWRELGIAGVAKKHKTSYNRAYNFYQKYFDKEVIK